MSEALNELYIKSNRRVNQINTDFKRYLFEKIDWRDRLICIKGARGTGKTTLMLQHIRETFGDSEKALYVSMDNLNFSVIELRDVAEEFVMAGGTHLFIDEIHYLNNWQLVLKNLYDDYPKLNIVYTGSSLLKIEKRSGDLSRRQIEYELYGLSFREYLAMEGILLTESKSLREILKNHVSIANEVTAEIKVMPLFNAYLKTGYYPFYREVYAGYYDRIGQVINQVLESDFPAIEPIFAGTVTKIKKMLKILAESCPQTPNMSKLYNELETDRNQGIKLLSVLDRAGLLSLLSSESKKLKNMSRPDKIYCDNTNLMYAVVSNVDKGCERETFFFNQLRAAGFEVSYPTAGDFLVGGKYLFEVGGRKKSFEQIADEDNSFLALDDTEVGRKNRIPLWLFGMMY